MSTFLSLCQDVARESGTVSNLPAPATTADQTQRLYRVVNWVKDAHRDVQLHANDWRWLVAEFSGNTIADTRAYDSSAMSISERFGRWIFHEEALREKTISAYKTSEGQSDEGYLTVLPWDVFRDRYMVGTAASQTGRPTHVAINPSNQLVFYPTPDADYTIRGEYYKAPLEFTADADEPEFPEMFHDIIKWRALSLLLAFDEAPDHLNANYHYRKRLQDLSALQRPRMRSPGPLA